MAKSPWPQVIRRQRLLQNLKQAQVAERAGVTDNTWSRWEQDGFSPNEKQQQQIADGLGCSVEDLRNWVAHETMGQRPDGSGGLSPELAALVEALRSHGASPSLEERGLDATLRAGEELINVLKKADELSRKDPFVENLVGASPGSGPESLADLSQYFISRHYVVVTSILHTMAEMHAAWPRFEAEATQEEKDDLVRVWREMSDLKAACLSISERLAKIRAAATDAEIAALADDLAAVEGL